MLRLARYGDQCLGRAARGDGFWGQVRGVPGRLRVLQRKGATSRQTGQNAGKARQHAPFPHHIAPARILHGKEGVDGSSPSEGSSSKVEVAANSGFFVAAADTVEHLLAKEGLRHIPVRENASKRAFPRVCRRRATWSNFWGLILGTFEPPDEACPG